MPTNFECHERCYHWISPSRGSPRVSVETISKQENQSVATVPFHRYAYCLEMQGIALYPDDFASMQRNIPSFMPGNRNGMCLA